MKSCAGTEGCVNIAGTPLESKKTKRNSSSTVVPLSVYTNVFGQSAQVIEFFKVFSSS